MAVTTQTSIEPEMQSNGNVDPSGIDDNRAPLENYGEKSIEYPSGWKLVFIFVALCLTVFLVALVYYLRASHDQP